MEREERDSSQQQTQQRNTGTTTGKTGKGQKTKKGGEEEKEIDLVLYSLKSEYNPVVTKLFAP